MVRRSIGRRCREAMRARLPRGRHANFAPAPTPRALTTVVARLAREELRVPWPSPASRRSILSLVPGAERPHTGAPGRAEHFVAYGGTGFLLALGYLGWRQRLVAWIGLAAASGVFEILQNFIPGRSPSLFDALASTGGLTLGTAVGVILTAALAWDRADGLLNADRGAAFRPALPFRRRRDPGND